jgi:molybdate transport system substrate-binding protein
VASLIASGKVELGFQQLSELLGVSGIDVIGALPAPIQQITTFSAALSPACSEVEAACGFVRFVASAQLDDLKQQYGMAGVPAQR